MSSDLAQQWDALIKKCELVAVQFPDHSTAYLSSALTKDDRNFLAKLFWINEITATLPKCGRGLPALLAVTRLPLVATDVLAARSEPCVASRAGLHHQVEDVLGRNGCQLCLALDVSPERASAHRLAVLHPHALCHRSGVLDSGRL